MNPSKVGKMDEEVQKWSRKDPQAIKKAMVYPGKISFSRVFSIAIVTFRREHTSFVSLDWVTKVLILDLQKA